MFETLRMNIKLNKILRSWPITIRDLTKIDKIAICIILHTMNAQKKLSIFKNKYVCTDAVLLSCFYALISFYWENGEELDSNSLFLRVFSSCVQIFKVPLDTIKKMFQNRQEVFWNMIVNSESLASISEEASYLFTYDMEYNEYVEFKKDSPLILHRFDTMLRVEAETKTFLSSMADILDNSV